jgi:hypothetical protein
MLLMHGHYQFVVSWVNVAVYHTYLMIVWTKLIIVQIVGKLSSENTPNALM